mmetsp:Transcript_16824/g.50249  ORF Transcript_16824/g.50249 Transcript_16824/m.50249 type:complete len:256 (-) Transcript_16824:432-1199(-)|eukprot:CAMPEP_0206150950 /NCGR_PEP_ID=MMETSP1473-20131121/38572_1 /ASSEMBLY_ACC=CAM_ASM_001109 /TAXON_ID=1461547 /ORGANISM="Stichococcus sp, Strain RCC1054" /LENGTH=255 /DNA_ID=CAMNT_0053548481 /DNA_START=100 /DNA_END=867 /DNA_ORIENTATION=+
MESGLDYDRTALVRQAAQLGSQTQSFSADKPRNEIILVTALAEMLSKLGPDHQDQVAALRDAVKRALTVQQECEAHKNALSTVGRQISAGPAGLERTQFDQVLEETRQEEIGASSYNPEQDPLIADFDQEVALARGADGPGSGSDDDVVLQVGAHDVAANQTCPLTMTPVLDLEDPVEDQRRIVYDRQSVERYIREKMRIYGPDVECPLAGSNHTISLAGLRKATAVLRAQKRRQRQPAHGRASGGAADGVLEVD